MDPWDPDTDPRSCATFLDQYYAKVRPYLKTNHDVVHTFQGLLRGRAENWFYLKYRDQVNLNGNLIIQEFINEFWSRNVQSTEISAFLNSKFPEYPDQKVIQYVNFWINWLEFNTQLDHGVVTQQLACRIPERYANIIRSMGSESYRAIINRLMEYDREIDIRSGKNNQISSKMAIKDPKPSQSKPNDPAKEAKSTAKSKEKIDESTFKKYFTRSRNQEKKTNEQDDKDDKEAKTDSRKLEGRPRRIYLIEDYSDQESSSDLTSESEFEKSTKSSQEN